MKLTSDFSQGSNINKLREYYTQKFVVISIALAKPGTIFSFLREITLMKKRNKKV